MMKSLRLLLFMTFFIAMSNASAQKPSRAETENWLQDKMNRYVTKVYVDCRHVGDPASPYYSTSDCYKYTNISFRFSGNDLVIKADVEKSFKGKVESNFSRTVTIPVYAITSTGVGFNSISFSTNYNAFSVQDSNGDATTQAFFMLNFQTNGEENFSERFKTAMSHLRTLVKKPRSTEAF